MHAEKVCRGPRDDLREPGRVRGVVSCDHVLTPGTLKHDDRLDQVGVDVGARCRFVHHGAKARRAPGCTNGSAGALLEEHVAQPKGGRLLVFLGSTRLEFEGIGVGDLHGRLQRDRRLCGLLLPQ